MLSMEDFVGRKVKKGCSKLDILAEVCSVAYEKRRLKQKGFNNLDILTEASSVADQKSRSERPVSPILVADGRSKGTLMPSNHRLALRDEELKEKRLPSLTIDTSLSRKDGNNLENANGLKEKQSPSLSLTFNSSHACWLKETDDLLKKKRSLSPSINESPLCGGRFDELPNKEQNWASKKPRSPAKNSSSKQSVTEEAIVIPNSATCRHISHCFGESPSGQKRVEKESSKDQADKERLSREKILKKPRVTEHQLIWETNGLHRGSERDGRAEETKLLNIATVKRGRVESEKALKKPMVADQRQFLIQNTRSLARKPSNESDRYSEEKKVPKAKKQKKTKVSEEKKVPKAKKQKKTKVSDETIPDMPEAYKNHIMEMNGSTDYKLVIQKRLTATDVDSSQTRLSIPLKQVKDQNFINDDEKEELKIHKNGSWNPLSAKIIGPKELKESEIKLRRWLLGKTSYSYVLGSGWNDFVVDHNLSAGDLIQLYSFRVDGKLHFAFVVVEKSRGKGSSSSPSEAIGEGTSSSSPNSSPSQVVAEVPRSSTLQVEALGESIGSNTVAEK